MKIPEELGDFDDEGKDWEEIREGSVSDEEMLSWFTAAAWEGLVYLDDLDHDEGPDDCEDCDATA